MGWRESEFMSDWVAENVNFVGYPTEDGIDPAAQGLALQCIADAEAKGISREELEKEFGDIPSFMHDQLERLADEEVRAKVARED